MMLLLAEGFLLLKGQLGFFFTFKWIIIFSFHLTFIQYSSWQVHVCLLYVRLTHQQVLDQLSHTGCSLCWLFLSGCQLDQCRQEVLTFLHILNCLLPKTQSIRIMNKFSSHLSISMSYIFYYTVTIYVSIYFECHKLYSTLIVHADTQLYLILWA